MQPRVSVITIGVDDLDVSLQSYRDGLGLATDGVVRSAEAAGAMAGARGA